MTQQEIKCSDPGYFTFFPKEQSNSFINIQSEDPGTANNDLSIIGPNSMEGTCDDLFTNTMGDLNKINDSSFINKINDSATEQDS